MTIYICEGCGDKCSPVWPLKPSTNETPVSDCCEENIRAEETE